MKTLSFMLILSLSLSACSSNHPAMPNVSQLADHPEMPDALMMNDSHRVTSAAQWAARRAEMKRTLEYYLTGTIPPPPGNVVGQVIESRDLPEANVRYQRVHLAFGPRHSIGFDIAIFIPASHVGPFPTIVHLNYTPTPGGGPVPTSSPSTMPAVTLEPAQAVHEYA